MQIPSLTPKILQRSFPGVAQSRAASHKGAQESATLSAGISAVLSPLDRELGQVPSAVSKTDGALRGLGCESSAIRFTP